MKNKLQISDDVLMNMDFFNTINGGASEPTVDIKNSDEGYKVILKTPGLPIDSLQVEVINNRLIVYHLVPIYANNPSSDTQMHSIRLINNHQIPGTIDIENISAEYDESGKSLTVTFPNNPSEKGIRKIVDIKK